MEDPIGDIKLTVRNDIGDQYLECNGDDIDNVKYPILHSKSEQATLSNKFNYIELQNGENIYPMGSKIIFDGTYYVFFDRDGNNTIAYYSREFNGTYQTKLIMTAPSNTPVYDPYYVNGYYIYATSDGGSNEITLNYSYGLLGTLSNTKVTLGGTFYISNGILKILYVAGFYTIVYTSPYDDSRQYLRIMKSKNINSGWTLQGGDDIYYRSLFSIHNDSTYIYVVNSASSSSSSSVYNAWAYKIDLQNNKNQPNATDNISGGTLFKGAYVYSGNLYLFFNNSESMKSEIHICKFTGGYATKIEIKQNIGSPNYFSGLNNIVFTSQIGNTIKWNTIENISNNQWHEGYFIPYEFTSVTIKSCENILYFNPIYDSTKKLIYLYTRDMSSKVIPNIEYGFIKAK